MMDFDWSYPIYGYGISKNMEVYGQTYPPVTDTANISRKVPVAIYVAKHDKVVINKDSKLMIKHLGPAVVDYAEMNGGHNAFVVGRDKSWF